MIRNAKIKCLRYTCMPVPFHVLSNDLPGWSTPAANLEVVFSCPLHCYVNAISAIDEEERQVNLNLTVIETRSRSLSYCNTPYNNHYP